MTTGNCVIANDIVANGNNAVTGNSAEDASLGAISMTAGLSFD